MEDPEKKLNQKSDGKPRKSPPIIDFGKIIIYTNNLKIIRTPMDKRDFMRKILQKEGEVEEESLMTKEEIYGDSDQNNGPLAETESTFPHNQYPQAKVRGFTTFSG
uniref:Glutaredoxin and cysteine rich domain containing 2 n=1 Tax=Molossus molossus TaxID=27622 RepID=A0A7J8I802_MOLMO|nr:glutaredoxin and cysteine rich domain containing 2 [Molossus molossus]